MQSLYLVMTKLDQILEHQRHELRLGYLEALGLLAIIALIVTAWLLYL